MSEARAYEKDVSELVTTVMEASGPCFLALVEEDFRERLEAHDWNGETESDDVEAVSHVIYLEEWVLEAVEARKKELGL